MNDFDIQKSDELDWDTEPSGIHWSRKMKCYLFEKH